jgi:hypothetical protein
MGPFQHEENAKAANNFIEPTTKLLKRTSGVKMSTSCNDGSYPIINTVIILNRIMEYCGCKVGGTWGMRDWLRKIFF